MSTQDFDQSPENLTRDQNPNFITQSELRICAAFEEETLPMRAKIVQKALAGGRVENGPLALAKPIREGRPLVVQRMSSKARERELLRSYSALDHAIADSEDAAARAKSVEEFRKARQKLPAEAWARWQERRGEVIAVDVWSRANRVITDWLVINEIAWLLMAATFLLRIGLIGAARGCTNTAVQDATPVLFG